MAGFGWGMVPGAAIDIGSIIAGMGMGNGYNQGMKFGNRAFMSNQGQLGSQVPALAQSYYRAMLGGPLGRSLRMNAMGAGNAAITQQNGALGGTGLMGSGLGRSMRGLAGSVGFNALSQGQAGMYSNAFQAANQNTMQNLMAAMQMGSNYGQDYNRMKWGLIGGGIGGLGQLAQGFGGGGGSKNG